MSDELLIAIAGSAGIIIGALISRFKDFVSLYDKVRDRKEQKKHDEIKRASSCDRLNGLFNAGHLLFLSGDPYPRQPICPRCSNDKTINYLQSHQPEGFQSLGFKPHVVASCSECSYEITMPTPEYKSAMEEAQRR